MKSYTDIEQSKKLAEILPIESADMLILNNVGRSGNVDGTNYHTILKENLNPLAEVPEILPCWSLGALLEILPKIVNTETLFIETSATLWHVGYRNVHTARETYLIDACYELILRLSQLPTN